MRVAAIELFVNVRTSRAAEPPGDAEAVMRALRAGAGERRDEALGAIRRAAALGAETILCPGWTFVGRAPVERALRAAAGGARVVFEVLDADGTAARGGEPRFPWRTLVHGGGKTRELAPQVVAVAEELEDDARAKELADALRTGRAAGDATVVVCGEVNVVRRRPRDGKVTHEWEPRVDRAGFAAAGLAGRIVLNPSHTPAGSYVRTKWKAGPWRAIVCTANTLDRGKLGRGGYAPPAHAIVDGRDVEGQVEETGAGSRVVVFEV